jgi:RNA polymerase sigma-70 factor (ECF subfamily)
LRRYAQAVLAGRADPDDVLQGVFCRVLQLTRSQVMQVADPAAWLAQVTRRQAINELRAQRRESARRDAAPRRVSHDTAHSSDAELQAALDALPRRLREIVVLRHVAGLSFDQIQAATGINRNTAASRYQAGVARLQSSLIPAAPRRDAKIRSSTIPPREVRHAR